MTSPRYMTSPIRNKPPTHNSTATESSRANHSANELQGAHPAPVSPALSTRQDASPSLPISDNAPDLRYAQARIDDHLRPPLVMPQQIHASITDLLRELSLAHQVTPLPQQIQVEINHLQQLLLPLQRHNQVDINHLLQRLFVLSPLLLPQQPVREHIDNLILRLFQLRQHNEAGTSYSTQAGASRLNEAWTNHPLLQLLPPEQNGQARTNRHLKHLLRLLQYDQEWTLKQLPILDTLSPAHLKNLLPLLKWDKEWTAVHLPYLKQMNGIELHRLLPLLQHNKEWTTAHLNDLLEIHERAWGELLLLLQHDLEWTTNRLPLLKKMDRYQWPYILPLLYYNRELTTDHLHELMTMKKDELRSLFLKLMDMASEGFISAANPYVREELFVKGRDIKEVTKVLQTHGASRSTINPESVIDSYLTEKFENNYKKIPTATFGVENEMFIPGLPARLHPESKARDTSKGKKAEALYEKTEADLNNRLGIKDKKYYYMKDGTLKGAPLATPPIEQATSILKFPADVQRLQSVLSILNDWEAFTNHTAGVHIHTGIKQWKAADCLETPEEKSKNPFLHQWDQEQEQKLLHYPSLSVTITPYQLLFMKQFLVNMVAMQKDFYLVSRESKYSQPNGPENDLDKYYRDISSARDYDELALRSSSGKVENNENDPGAPDRYFNINLRAFQKHKTIEVRGFTKKNSDTMEIDPNLPVRDLIFLQEVLIKVLHETKNILLSGASPDAPIEVRPSAGLDEVVKGYVQDVFLLEIIHALGQRNSEKRVKTMAAIVKDKDLIESDTLQKIRESQKSLFDESPLAQHFLAALNGDEQWNPSSINKNLLKRTNSLRSMADVSLEAIYRSHKRPRWL